MTTCRPRSSRHSSRRPSSSAGVGVAVARARRAAGLQPGDRDPERRAGDVVQARVVEEVHRVRVAAVLAADAELEVGPGGRGPSSTAMRDQRGRRRRGRWSRTGRRRRCPAPGSGEKNDASTSSREKPQVIWVRSLVPKEKNSAASAIWPAVSAARGTSIIVPIGAPVHAVASRSAMTCSASVADRLQLLHGADQRDHDLRPRVAAGACSSAAASAIARTCMANRPGMTRPSRTPRRPSIGFCSCIRLHGGQQRAVVVRRPARASARATLTASSSRAGRNSCSGGSMQPHGHRQAVHRREDARRSRPAAAAAARPAPPARSSSVVRPGSAARPARRRSPRNMCSVRHRPMPSAPNRRARAASSAVSALARTPQPAHRVGVRHAAGRTRRDQRVARRRSSSPSKYSHHRGRRPPAPRRGRPRRWCRRWR